MQLQVQTQPMSPLVVGVSLSGRIDNHTAPELKEEIDRLLAGPAKTLVLDMAKVDMVTSAGIGTIVAAQETAKHRGGDLAMNHLQPQVKRVFEIMSLVPTLNVFESQRELDEYLIKVQERIINEREET